MKAGSLACQIREHLHLAMPGYAGLFDRLFESPAGLSRATCVATAGRGDHGRTVSTLWRDLGGRMEDFPAGEP